MSLIFNQYRFKSVFKTAGFAELILRITVLIADLPKLIYFK